MVDIEAEMEEIHRENSFNSPPPIARRTRSSDKFHQNNMIKENCVEIKDNNSKKCGGRGRPPSANKSVVKNELEKSLDSSIMIIDVVNCDNKMNNSESCPEKKSKKVTQNKRGRSRSLRWSTTVESVHNSSESKTVGDIKDDSEQDELPILRDFPVCASSDQEEEDVNNKVVDFCPKKDEKKTRKKRPLVIVKSLPESITNIVNIERKTTKHQVRKSLSKEPVNVQQHNGNESLEDFRTPSLLNRPTRRCAADRALYQKQMQILESEKDDFFDEPTTNVAAKKKRVRPRSVKTSAIVESKTNSSESKTLKYDTDEIVILHDDNEEDIEIDVEDNDSHDEDFCINKEKAKRLKQKITTKTKTKTTKTRTSSRTDGVLSRLKPEYAFMKGDVVWNLMIKGTGEKKRKVEQEDIENTLKNLKNDERMIAEILVVNDWSYHEYLAKKVQTNCTRLGSEKSVLVPNTYLYKYSENEEDNEEIFQAFKENPFVKKEKRDFQQHVDLLTHQRTLATKWLNHNDSHYKLTCPDDNAEDTLEDILDDDKEYDFTPTTKKQVHFFSKKSTSRPTFCYYKTT
jgi:hypothetical protein